MVVDDHPVVRQGVINMLKSQNDISVVGEARDPETARQCVADTHPDVVLLDMRLPSPIGASLAVELKKIHPPVHIIILTAFQEDELLVDAISAGVDAYLLKTIGPDEMAASIRRVQAGEKLTDPTLVGSMMNALQLYSSGEPLEELRITRTERKLLHLIAEGASNQEIAEAIFVSEVTVKRYLARLYKKLGVSGRIQAVVEAARRGLI